jgi:hypothetical protein
MTANTLPCPGFARGERDENFKFECSCCGRRISKRGYSSSLAAHRAPSDVVHAHLRGQAQAANEYEQNRRAQARQVDVLLDQLIKLGMDVSSGTPRGEINISLPLSTVERLIAIAQAENDKEKT